MAISPSLLGVNRVAKEKSSFVRCAFLSSGRASQSRRFALSTRFAGLRRWAQLFRAMTNFK
jgi:hypothetical protein